MPKVEPHALNLAAEEASYAAARGDKETYREVITKVTGTISERADFARKVLIADATKER